MNYGVKNRVVKAERLYCRKRLKKAVKRLLKRLLKGCCPRHALDDDPKMPQKVPQTCPRLLKGC